LQLLLKTLEQFDQQIAKVFQQHPDRPIFEALPGAGPVLAPRLLASMGSERERFPQPGNLQCLSGVAPVTKQSGGKCCIHRRYLCPKFLRQSFHEYAKESILHSRWAAAYYGQQRSKGCHHHTAVRALAYKWQRIIWKCWQSRTASQEAIYEAALKKSKSPLVGLFDQIELGKSPVKNRAKKSLVGLPAHRPRACDAGLATETQSRGSVQPVCSASFRAVVSHQGLISINDQQNGCKYALIGQEKSSRPMEHRKADETHDPKRDKNQCDLRFVKHPEPYCSAPKCDQCDHRKHIRLRQLMKAPDDAE